MLRRLLRDSEAAKALFEKLGMFKSPELLEKYVIASEVTVDALFFCRVFAASRLWEGLCGLRQLANFAKLL